MIARSLADLACGATLEQWVRVALAAADPAQAVRRWLHHDGDVLRCGEWSWRYGADRRVIVVGGGKAGAPMTHAVVDLIGDWQPRGVVVVNDGQRAALDYGAIEVVEAAHPTPDQRGVAAAQRISTLLDQAQPDDVVIVLISGGASALLAAPVATITLPDLQTTTQVLLASGAPISAINTVRKHCETLKGGQLAQRAAPAHVLGLILSDVVGSPLDVIASGMTVADQTRYADALAVLEQFHVLEHVPVAVRQHLERGVRGDIADTPKILSPLVVNQLVASNADALHAVANHARAQGWHVELLPTFEGEARNIGQAFGALLRARSSNLSPTLLLAGGETTVTFTRPDPSARGGRNQELALAAAHEIAGLDNVALVALATDGVDGNSPAAGALATGTTIQRLQALGFDPAQLLDAHQSFEGWHALGDALQLAPTLTNVNDIVFAVIA